MHKLLETSSKARFALEFAGHIHKRFEDMFIKPTNPTNLPRGYDVPYNVDRPPYAVRQFMNDQQTYDNVDYAGKTPHMGTLI